MSQTTPPSLLPTTGAPQARITSESRAANGMAGVADRGGRSSEADLQRSGDADGAAERVGFVEPQHSRWADALTEATDETRPPTGLRHERTPQTANGDELGHVLAALREEHAVGLALHQPHTEASPLDLLPRQVAAGQAGQTLGRTPWLGLRAAPAGGGAAPATADLPFAPADATALRSALAETLPGRLEGVAAHATDAELATLQTAVSEPPLGGRPSLPEGRPALEARAAGAPPAGDSTANSSEDPAAGSEDNSDNPATRSAQARPSPGAGRSGPAPATGAAAQAGTSFQAAVPAPGAEVQRLPEGATVARVTTTTPATVASGRSVEAQMFQQNVVADMHRVELDVQDGDDRLRVTLAREVDGLAVEVRSPRDLVAELRALRPEVEQAFAEEGHDLAAFDAEEDPSLEREAEEEAESWADGTPNPDTSTRPASSRTDHDGLLSREA